MRDSTFDESAELIESAVRAVEQLGVLSKMNDKTEGSIFLLCCDWVEKRDTEV